MTAGTSAGTGTCTGTGTGTDTGTDTGTGTRDSENEREVHGEPSVNYCQIDLKKTVIDAQKQPVKPKHGGRKGKELLQQVPAHGTDEEQQERSEDLPQVQARQTGNGSVSSNGIMEGGNEQVPEVSAHGIRSKIVQPPQGQVEESGEEEVAEVSALGTESAHPPFGTVVEGGGGKEVTKLSTHGTVSQIVQSSHGTVEGGREKKAPKVPAHGATSQRLQPLGTVAEGKNEAPQVPAHETRIERVPQQGTAEAVPQDPTHGAMKREESQVPIQLPKHEMGRGVLPAYAPRRGNPTVLSAHGTEHKASGVLSQNPTGAIVRGKNGAPQVPAKPTSAHGTEHKASGALLQNPTSAIVREKNGAPQVPAKPTSAHGTEHKASGALLQNPTSAVVREKNGAPLQVPAKPTSGREMPKTKGGELGMSKVNQEVLQILANKVIAEKQEKSSTAYPLRADRAIRENQQRTKEVPSGCTGRTNQERSKEVSPVHTDKASQERNIGVSPMSTNRPEGGSQGRGKGMSSVHTDRPIGTSQGRGRGRRPAYGTEMRN